MLHGRSLSVADRNVTEDFGSLEENIQLAAQLRDLLGARFVQIAPPDMQ